MSVHQKTRVDEEEDLDDLDDVLDQFSPSAQPASTSPQPTTAGASTSTQPAAEGNEALTEDFKDKLADEMASLFKGLGIEPGAESEGADGPVDRKQLKAAWEAMLVEDMDAMLRPGGTRTSADASSPKPKDDDFQSRIRSTMNKLKESETGLKSSDPVGEDSGDSLQSLLSQLEGIGDLSGDGAGSEEQLQGVLEAMMGQLMGKEVLYEPLKELNDKFPEYLDKNSSTISAEDQKRFDAQISCIKRLIDEFESKTYRDEDEKSRAKIVELMNELQTYGSPPDEVMGPLPPGFSMGQDGLPNLPDACNIH